MNHCSYMQKLKSIKNLEKRFREKQSIFKANKLVSKLGILLECQDEIPEKDLAILKPRFSLYCEWPKGNIANIKVIEEIEKNSFADLLNNFYNTKFIC